MLNYECGVTPVVFINALLYAVCDTGEKNIIGKTIDISN